MDVDVIVIGSGQAGVPLATRLAKTGKKVVLAERGKPGGTCINVGCTPTKTLIGSAAAAHSARTAKRLGVHVGEVKVDLAAVVDRKNALVSSWRDGIQSQLESTEGLTFVKGHARFVGPREIEVNGTRYAAETIVINVGARPTVPSVPGLEQVPWLDNAKLMELREVPRKLLVIGGGYIGCELGQAFRRFGAEVTIFDPRHLLSRQDPDISETLEDAFRKEGITLELGSRVKSVAKTPDGGVAVKLDKGKEVTGSHLLVATGRTPNTADLGADKAGIALDDRGFVKVNDRYETNVRGVYAVGDCTGGPQFTHTSWDDHRILFDLLAGTGKRTREGRTIPWVAFTDPQVAGVGVNETEAKKRGLDVEAVSMDFGNIARASELDVPAGKLKALLDKKTGLLVGATFVGAEAGELLHILVPLMQAKVSPSAIVDAEFAHPTFAEGLQSLIMKFERYQLKP